MPFDPTLPRNNAPIVAAELRNQFQEIQNNIDAVREQLQVVQPLGLTVTVSNPPTQAQVQAIANKLDELINTLLAV